MADDAWRTAKRKTWAALKWIRRGGFGAARERSLRARLALRDTDTNLALVDMEEEDGAPRRRRFQESWNTSCVGRSLAFVQDHIPFIDSIRLNTRRRTLRAFNFLVFGWCWILLIQLLFFSLSLGSFELAAVLTFFLLPVCGFCGFLCTKNFICPLAILIASFSVWLGGFYLSEWYRLDNAVVVENQSAMSPPPSDAEVFYFSDAFVFSEYTGRSLNRAAPKEDDSESLSTGSSLSEKLPLGFPALWTGVQAPPSSERQTLQGSWYCVAPLVTEDFINAFSANRNVTVFPIYFWATCYSAFYSCDSEEFRTQSSCRRDWDILWRSGYERADSNVEYYESAVAQAERFYRLRSDPDRKLIVWVNDPTSTQVTYERYWILAVVLTHALYCFICEWILAYCCCRYSCEADPLDSPPAPCCC